MEKKIIQREVKSIIETIDFKRSFAKNKDIKDCEQCQKEIKEWIRSIRFGTHRENYIFVYEIEDFEGGEKFAKMLVNANRADLEGKYISDAYKDADGKEFRKIFLKDIVKSGNSFVHYMYKKVDSNEIRPKVSYFELYPEWNWVIAAGTYLDDIDSNIAEKKAKLNRTMQLEVTSAIGIFLFFSLIANAFTIFFGRQIDRFFKEYNSQIREKTVELENLNKDLENKIDFEVQKRREQEQLLIEKSKFIALGEMISNIAHQWRQPLSQLSAIMMTIKLKHKLSALDTKTMQEKSKEAENLLVYMSKTIDDFREFFMPSKEKKEFCIKEAIDAVINIIGKASAEVSIKIDLDIPQSELVLGHKSEYEQVLLNIITNAKQALLGEKIENPTIYIALRADKIYSYLTIEDNAGGIKAQPIEKIFAPYFTTKEESGGTGIGLYMSKIIIEKSMGGAMYVKNSKKGAVFTIRMKRVEKN